MTRGALERLIAMSSGRRLLLLETPVALGLAVLRVRILPFRLFARRLGQHGRIASNSLTHAQKELARDVEWLIGAYCRRLLVTPTCLEQAAAAKALLTRHGVPATVYIGVAQPSALGVVNAHAWLTCGKRVVTGRSAENNFQPIVWFG